MKLKQGYHFNWQPANGLEFNMHFVM